MHGRNPIEEPAVFAAQLPASTDLRALHRLNPARYPFLLQSTAVSTDLGRYDILFAFPGDSLVLDEPGQLSGRHNIEPAVSPDGKQLLFVSEFVD